MHKVLSYLSDEYIVLPDNEKLKSKPVSEKAVF